MIKNNAEIEFKRFKTRPEKISNFSVIIETILLIFFFFNSIKLLCRLFLKILIEKSETTSFENLINKQLVKILKDAEKKTKKINIIEKKNLLLL